MTVPSNDRRPFCIRTRSPISDEEYRTPGNWFFITTRALYGQSPFTEPDRCRIVLDQLVAQSAACGCAVGPYCLMPDHLHLIVTPTVEGGHGVREFTRRLHGATTNKLWPTGWEGRVWQSGSYDVLLPNEAAARESAQYIWQNPVHASLCEVPEDWPWSGCISDLDFFNWP